MNRLSVSGLVFLVAGFLLAACTKPSPAAEVKATERTTGATPAGAAWEQKWESILTEAKKEGEITIYSSLSAEARNALAEAFRDKYGLKLEFLTLSRGSEISARAASEQKAGLYVADAFFTGSSTFVVDMKPHGILGPMEPLLILPEVRDPKVWLGGKLPFSDADGLSFDLIGAVWGAYLANSDLIKGGEITSYLDVLKPIYKGKIVTTDPGQSGSANAMMTHFAHNLWDTAKAMDFLRQLMKLELVITRDYRQQVEWIARGKYAIAIGPDSKQTASFVNEGAPIALVWPREGAYVSSVGGSVAISVRPAHPNATTVFVNWLLTKEVQTLFSRQFGLPSTRLDAPSVINPKLLPPPDLKIFMQSERSLQLQGKIAEAAREVITAASK